MSRILFIIVVLIALFLQACASTNVVTLQGNTNRYLLPGQEVAKLNAAFEQYTNSPALQKFDNIESGYLAILARSPGYIPAMRGLYSSYYFESQSVNSVKHDRRELDKKLASLFWQMPSLVRQEFYPPAFALYHRRLALSAVSATTEADVELLNILRQSASEAPQNSTIRVLLAEQILTLQKEQVGVALIKEAWKAQPSEDIYPHALGNLQYRTVLDGICPQEQAKNLTPALNYYRETLTLNPEAEVHYEMGVIYGLLRLTPLMLNEADVLASQNNLNSYWQAAYLYMHAKQLNKAKQMFQQANELANLKEQPQSRAYVDYLMLNNLWADAAEHYRYYLNAKLSLTSYDLLVSSLIWSQLIAQKPTLTMGDVWPANRKVNERYQWPYHLMSVLFGEEPLESDVSQIGATACNQVQLSFYAAIHAKSQNQSEKIKILSTNLDKENLPFSIESQLASKLFAPWY